MSELENSMSNVRSTDGTGNQQFKITREIPLPWLVGGVILLAGQAITLYFGQQSQAQTLAQQSTDIKVLSAKIDGIVDKRNEDVIKNIQRDNLISRNGDRLSIVEDALKSKGIK